LLLHETLPNGVEVAIKENHFSRTVAIQVWVGVGSIHEGPDERGMAHYLEHMLFKGTHRRESMEIASAVEAAGGEINAYTTFDHTVFHLTMPSAALELGVDILSDVTFQSRFDPTEFEREREVILEEIRRGLDNPGTRIGQRVFQLAFEGTEAGRPIIGSVESVKAFTRDQLAGFHRKWYRPDAMTVVIVGDVDGAAALEVVKKWFGTVAWPTTERPTAPLPFERKPVPSGGPRVSLLKGDWQKPRIELTFRAPELEHPDTAALDLAAFALGSGELSRLSRRARDQEGVVTAVSASVYAPRFGGLFEVSAFATEESVLDSVRVLARETIRLRHSEPVTVDELMRARANLKADRIYRDETVDGQARSLGFGLRTAHKLVYDELYTAQINALPDAQIARAVTRWLDPAQAMIVALLPQSSPLTEQDFADAYARGVEEGLQRAGGHGTTPHVETDAGGRPSTAAQVIPLKEGVRLVYRLNPKVSLFTLTLASEGGLRAETEEDAGTYHAISAMLAAATERRGFEEFIGGVEARGASIEGFSGKDSFGFHLQCLPEHAETMVELLAECLMEPAFPDEQWQSIRRDLEQSIATQDDSPASVCMRKFQQLAFGKHPYRFPLYGHAPSIASFDREVLLQRYVALRDGGPWVVAATGPFPEGDVVKLLGKALASFQPSARPRHFPSEAWIGTGSAGHEKIAKDREQTHLVYGFPGITWGDPERAALDVLMNVLGGHGGRLFRKLRDQESLAYSVSPIVSYGKHPGAVGSYIACAPSKEAQAAAGLRSEMLALVAQAPEPAEVDRARNYIIGTHEMSLQRSDAQTSTMALMELYGYGHDDFLTYPARVAAVTPADVQAVAARLFVEARAMLVVVGPHMIDQGSQS
jgi:zinc protease